MKCCRKIQNANSEAMSSADVRAFFEEQFRKGKAIIDNQDAEQMMKWYGFLTNGIIQSLLGEMEEQGLNCKYLPPDILGGAAYVQVAFKNFTHRVNLCEFIDSVLCTKDEQGNRAYDYNAATNAEYHFYKQKHLVKKKVDDILQMIQNNQNSLEAE
jgi:hypothetical protein